MTRRGLGGFFTLRACPPTHSHAPYLYVPCTLAPCPASAMRMLTPWVGGTKGPKGGAPGGQGAARGRTRAARAHGRTRALRALGPFGPLGPLGPKGTAYTQQKLCQTEYIIPTNAIPYGINTGGNQETFSLKFKEGFSAESGANPRTCRFKFQTGASAPNP